MATETHEPGNGDAVASSCVDVGGNAVGLPQLCFEWFPNQIFWLAVALAAIFFLLSRVALPRIAAVLADRRDAKANDLAAAEELKRKAEEAETAYEKSLAEAREQARKIAAATKAEIQAGVDEATKKADAEIAAKTAESEKAIAAIRDGAVASIREVAAAAAGDIVAALGGKADETALAAAIDQEMKGIDK